MSSELPATATSPLTWEQARELARHAIDELPTAVASVDDCVGSVLTQPLTALADIPAYDTALVDGWAVSGPGPWTIKQADRRDLFAGRDYREPGERVMLRDGQATQVSTGAPLGDGVTGVVASYRCVQDGEILSLTKNDNDRTSLDQSINVRTYRDEVTYGSGMRPRGTDATANSTLLPAGHPINPAVAALAAAAGHDQLDVIPPPRVALIRVGDAALARGIPRHGLPRDTVFPALPSWVQGLGGQAQPARWVNDGDLSLIDEIEDLLADIIVTSGPSAEAAVRRILLGLDAELIVDGVAVTPGDSMLLARLPDGRPLIHCGGSAQDALAALLTLLAPMITTATGQADRTVKMRLDDATFGDRYRTTLMPVTRSTTSGNGVRLLTAGGPGGLFALSEAFGLAVIPPKGVRAYGTISVLPLPVI